MNTWIRRTLQVGLLSAGFVVAAGVAAHADDSLLSSGNTGILNGNQAVVPIQVPINVCGNGVGVLGLGIGSGTCDATATMKRAGDVSLVSDGNTGIANGNQLYAPIQVPINVCGNGVGVLGGGIGSGTCSTTATLKKSAQRKSTTAVSNGNTGVGNGNQLIAPIQVPVNVCGNGVGVLGGGVGSGTCSATAKSGPHTSTSAAKKSGSAKAVKSGGGSDVTLISTDNTGILVGNQAYVPIQVPVNACGNGVGVLGGGIGSGTCSATATMKRATVAKRAGLVRKTGTHGHGACDVTLVSTNNTGILVGNQAYVPIQVPVNVVGNGVGVAGVGIGSGTGAASATMAC